MNQTKVNDMEQEKSLEDKMLEAIRQAHWQSTPSESKVAARECAIIARQQVLEYLYPISLVACNESTIQVLIRHQQNEIEKLKNNP